MNDNNRKQLGVQQHSMVDRTKRRRVITLPMVMVIVYFLFLSKELFPLMERNEMTPMMTTLLQTSTTTNNHDRQEPKHQNKNNKNTNTIPVTDLPQPRTTRMTGNVLSAAAAVSLANSSTPETAGVANKCGNLLFQVDLHEDCPVLPRSPLHGHGPSTCPPNYFIPGTRKGGTTSLHTYLTAHPDIFPFKLEGGPQDGEAFGQIGTEGYAQKFRHVPDHQMVGDSTVMRLMNDGTKASPTHCRHARLLLLFRDPVERCNSQMLMRQRVGYLSPQSDLNRVMGMEIQKFRKTLRAYQALEGRQQPQQPPGQQQQQQQSSNNQNAIPQDWYTREDPIYRSAKSCLYEGAYIVHLRRLLAANFPPSQIRIYWSDDLFHQPAAVVRDAMLFVGADPSLVNVTEITSRTYNTKHDIPPPVALVNKHKWNATASTRPPVPLKPELREQIQELMRPFDEELGRFLGVNPPWL